MQFILAILALLLYAAVYAVGFVVVGIIELVKYIKSRKEESYKTADTETKRRVTKNHVSVYQKNIVPKPTNLAETEPVITHESDKEEKSDNLNLTSDIPNDNIETDDNIVEKQITVEQIQSTVSPATISLSPEENPQEFESGNLQIGSIIQSLIDNLNNRETPTDDTYSDDIEKAENNKVLLGELVDALKNYKERDNTVLSQPANNHSELFDLLSSLKDNANLKSAKIVQIIDALTTSLTHKASITEAKSKPQNVNINNDKNGEEQAKISPKTEFNTPKVTNESATLLKEKSYPSELAQFNNVIYHVKLLGHEDSRFQLITMKAYEIISKFGESQNFFTEVIKATEGDAEFATEIIRYIVIQKSHGVSDIELIKKIRNKYIGKRESIPSNPTNVFQTKPENTAAPIYIETETSPASRKLAAKSKIAHKHKAIQYANVIGGKLIDEYNNSGESSFYEYVKKQCKSLADRGDCSITTEEFEPHRNIIATYKKSKKKSKHRAIATNIITPKHNTGDRKAETVLKILDKLTSSRLPRYEIPAYPSSSSIVQREYKKTNPFDVYNDLVSSEYNPAALKDKRFAVLYQLILFISECVENGMSEEETLAAISTLRVVNKRDLNILRDREIRFKGLSKSERELVLDSEICNSRDMTNLYIDLIRHHKQTKQRVKLNDYIIGVLLKNYKESYAAWRLLKYIYLKTNKLTNNYIVDNKWSINEIFFINETNHGTRDISEIYYSLEDSIAQLKYEYDHYIDMIHYNFQRDNITTDMLNVPTLKQYLPKRFDSKGRLCTLVMVTPIEAELFNLYDKRNVGDHIYVLFPVAALTTKDLYGLLLTVNKQKRKQS